MGSAISPQAEVTDSQADLGLTQLFRPSFAEHPIKCPSRPYLHLLVRLAIVGRPEGILFGEALLDHEGWESLGDLCLRDQRPPLLGRLPRDGAYPSGPQITSMTSVDLPPVLPYLRNTRQELLKALLHGLTRTRQWRDIPDCQLQLGDTRSSETALTTSSAPCRQARRTPSPASTPCRPLLLV